MYEKLVNALRCYAKDEECHRCEYFSEAGCDIDGMLFDAADAIVELQKLTDAQLDIIKQYQGYLTKHRWIPVTERLPEDRHDVLVYAGVLFPYITVGYYDGLWKFSFNDEEIAGSADYWMPLPEPPKEET